MFPARRSSPTGASPPPVSGDADVAYLRVVSTDAYADWESVYRDNVGRLYRLMYARVGNRPDAEDLTSEVFRTALGPLRMTSSKGEVRSYLLVTAATVLASHWRRSVGMPVTSIDPGSDFRLPERALGARPAQRRPGPGRWDSGRPSRSLPAHPGTPISRDVLDQRGGPRHGCQRQQREGPPTPCLAHGGEGGTGVGTVTHWRLSAFIDALVDGRRPGKLRADPEDVAVLRTAIALRAARPGDAIPDEQFVSDLYASLAEDNPVEGRAGCAFAQDAPRPSRSRCCRGRCGAGRRDGRGHRGPQPSVGGAGGRAGTPWAGFAYRDVRDGYRPSHGADRGLSGEPFLGVHERRWLQLRRPDRLRAPSGETVQRWPPAPSTCSAGQDSFRGPYKWTSDGFAERSLSPRRGQSWRPPPLPERSSAVSRESAALVAGAIRERVTRPRISYQ